jgi:signal transduction histidine kinase
MTAGFDATEVTAVRPSGESFPAELRARPFATARTPQLLMIFEDITQRHEIERMKKEFVSMISHDLRTPLTSIQCFLSVVADGAFSDVENLQRRAKIIEGESTRLINMINNLLNIDRMESGRLEMFMDAVLLPELVERSVQAVSSLADHRAINLQTDLPTEEVHLLADLDYAIQVLVNLLSNALKFSPKGATVTVRGEATADEVKVTVLDKGRGIPMEFRNRIFNRFGQATISNARVKGGSGLGLAISKLIVEQHGGTIGFDSEEGQGTAFWFTMKRLKI